MLTVFAAGGVVMGPLLLFSLVAIALIIERLIFWLRISRSQAPLLRRVLQTYQDNVPSAVTLLRQNLNFPLARIFLEALRPRQRRRNRKLNLREERWKNDGFTSA